MISVIVAMGVNSAIGYKGKLPWHLPSDLKYFKEKTAGHTVVMGRNTYESIGKPLPNRTNVVLSRNKDLFYWNCIVVDSVDSILDISREEEVFIIGGAEVYRSFLPYADKLYITKIHALFVGDTYFPKINTAEWELVNETSGEVDGRNEYEHDFQIYERKNKNIY